MKNLCQHHRGKIRPHKSPETYLKLEKRTIEGGQNTPKGILLQGVLLNDKLLKHIFKAYFGRPMLSPRAINGRLTVQNKLDGPKWSQNLVSQHSDNL